MHAGETRTHKKPAKAEFFMGCKIADSAMAQEKKTVGASPALTSGV